MKIGEHIAMQPINCSHNLQPWLKIMTYGQICLDMGIVTDFDDPDIVDDSVTGVTFLEGP